VSWFVVNPIGRFGYCAYGLTVYSALPVPGADIQVRSDVNWRRVGKTHDLRLEAVQWLLESSPDVLIIATGWDGVTRPDQAIVDLHGYEVHIARNAEAIGLYNRFRRAGRLVSIHSHSTC
jgi:hypothetical protein